MSIRISRNNSQITIHIKGRLDRERLPEFRELYQSIESETGPLVIDLKEATFIDSMGLHELEGMKTFLGREDGEIVFKHTPSTIKTLLANIRFDRHFQIA